MVAEEVYERGLNTYIPKDSYCASACSFVFFAGRQRQAEDRRASDFRVLNDGRIGAVRRVGKVVDNKPVPVASCSFNGVDANCPGGISDDARWNTGSEVHKVDSSTPWPKVDGAVHDDEDALSGAHAPDSNRSPARHRSPPRRAS